MFFNWLKKESKIKNQREELLKEAQKNEDSEYINNLQKDIYNFEYL